MNPGELETILETLAKGDLRLEGQLLWGSNYTFLAHVTGPAGELRAVYKPQRGERPLWDFPDGTLARREVAAYRASAALGWDLVPPTALREDGPAGPGSIQVFLDVDPERHVFTFTPEERLRLRPVAVFDALINNADRKGGHILMGPDGHLWLIDHGVCFHTEDKLRTVLWDFAGEGIPQPLLRDLERFAAGLARGGGLQKQFGGLLSEEEIGALRRRAKRLLAERRFPIPGPGRPYPWPLV
ncbi:MAG TPA: SCO1664 family protein [Anaerolineales bacterium]|nr:SCO1664 family protein [Anaerolineales bacterium]